jgi:hypothetical protein
MRAGLVRHAILNICGTPLHRFRSPRGSVTKMELTMENQWTLEMHHPGDAGDSLITTDRFDEFSDVERMIKQNREMVFVVRPPASPIAGELQMLDELKQSGLRIERK